MEGRGAEVGGWREGSGCRGWRGRGAEVGGGGGGERR